MTSTNVMEVISKGRFEMVEEIPRSSSGRPDSQLSLEYLPPEEPQYSGVMVPTESSLEKPLVEGSLGEAASQDLYSRVRELSERIRTELHSLKETESLEDDDDEEEEEEEVEEEEEEDCLAERLGGPYSPLGGGSLSNDGSTQLFLRCPPEDQSVRDSRSPTDDDTSMTSSDVHCPEVPSDSRLEKAMEKMKKLDKKLASVVRREREVKKQRRLLEQQMEAGGKSLSRELVPVESVEDDSDMPLTSPVFHTQVNENPSTAGEPQTSAGAGSSEVSSEREQCIDTAGDVTEQHSKASVNDGMETDFIQRNIELARNAGATVAMTEAERKRLEELLDDELEIEHPYTMPLGLTASEGFLLSEEDVERMRDIDSRLQAIMPPGDWEPVCMLSGATTPSTPTPSLTSAASHSSVPSPPTAVDEKTKLKLAGPGEEVLHKFQLSREESQRLREIEETLAIIQQANLQQLPPLLGADLQALLEHCYQHTPQATQTPATPPPETTPTQSPTQSVTDCVQTQ